MAAVVVADLTEAGLAGTGVFDVLMRSVKAHLNEEYSRSRITGPQYADVYLGSLQAVMNTSLQFLLQQQKTDLEAQLLQKQIDLVTQQTALAAQQTANALTENTVLVAQECKLKAEFDLIMQNVLKAVEETGLLAQKKATEKAQTVELGVDDNSVVGKQKLLYQAQIDGFAHDARQKAAKLLVDTWNVRRTTDEATVADTTNKLDDATIGQVVSQVINALPGQ